MDSTLQTALHHQMSMIQELIKRMSENSRNTKTWAISLVSALLVFSSKTVLIPWYILILPVLPLMYIDMYYLALETFYREQYNKLKTRYKENKITIENIYDIENPNGSLDIFFQFGSKSIWPFYGLLMAVAGLIGYFLATQVNCIGA
ncbi:MAG: hypothetical protein LCH67_18895 [Bacteroidetes bacterium]|nr:hypothetical protein [Bacteroidota bacterium]